MNSSRTSETLVPTLLSWLGVITSVSGKLFATTIVSNNYSPGKLFTNLFFVLLVTDLHLMRDYRLVVVWSCEEVG